MYKVRTRNKYKTFREIEKEDRIFGNYKVKCKCSHVVLFTRGKDRIICSHCGNYIYKDKKIEMKYKLKEIMKDEKE